MENLELLTPKKIIYSKRKSLSLIIDNNGDLIVRAPLRCSDKKIYEFIFKKADWIIKTKQKVINNTCKPLNLSNGEIISILGKNYKISLYEKSKVTMQEDVIFIPKTESHQKFINFLKRLAKTILTQKVAEISEIYGFSYISITISSAKTNWGSCSFNNRLHFTYRLMLCPIPVVEYLIKHELTHTKVKNHSKDFYKELERICPNYKECEKWLKVNKGIMELI